MESSNDKSRPNLERWLFWDQRFDDIDWKEGSRGVIERVLQRGSDKDYDEIIRFYGRERIVEVLTKEYCYIQMFMMEHVAAYFDLPKEEFTIFKRRLVKPSIWI